MDTALARQQDLSKVIACIAAMLRPLADFESEEADKRIQNAFASMFSAASLPRLTGLSKHDREAELKHLASITLGERAYAQSILSAIHLGS